MASITITQSSINSGNPITIKASSVDYTGKRNNRADPNPNSDLVEVQTISTENPLVIIGGINITGEVNTLSLDHVKALYKLKNLTSTHAVLTIIYGEDDELTSLTGSTDIPVVLSSFSFKLSTADTKKAYLPRLSLSFTEDVE